MRDQLSPLEIKPYQPLDYVLWSWYYAVRSLLMAKKRKKTPKTSRRKKRRINLQQIVFVVFAIIVIASFLVSLIT
jgi:hypothetical protein